MDRMNNCFIRNSDNPARVILFVNDVRRIDDLRARKSCGTRINRIIIYFGNCSGRYFSAEKIPSSFCIYLSPLRSIDRVCFNNLPVERWSNCIFTGLPLSLTWLIVSRNSSDCWTIEILWSGKCVETKRIELVFKFLLLIGKWQFLRRNPFVFRQLVLSVYPRAWHDYSS